LKSYQDYVKDKADKLEKSLSEDAVDCDALETNPELALTKWISEDVCSFIKCIERDYAWAINFPEDHYEHNGYIGNLNHESCMMIIKNSNNIHYSIDGMYRKDNYTDVAENAFRADVIEFLLNKLGIKYDIKKICVLNRAR